MSTIRFDDNRGGLDYPFLPAELGWEIVSRPFDNESALAEIFAAEAVGPDGRQAGPCLRWVKDDKVLDLYIPGLDTQSFLARTGLHLSLEKGGYVLSKRLSRVMRPFRYWGFFQADQVTIYYDSTLDGRLWDGCGLVSPRFIDRLAADPRLDERQRRELRQSGRFEVTTLHAGGQDKGHVLVSQWAADMDCDFIFPAGSAKSELRLEETLFGPTVFVGLQPVHSADQICLDIQSIINLHPPSSGRSSCWPGPGWRAPCFWKASATAVWRPSSAGWTTRPTWPPWPTGTWANTWPAAVASSGLRGW